MRHVTKTQTVEAFRIPKGVALTLSTPDGKKHAVTGDWLTVTPLEGPAPAKWETMSDGEFASRFEAAGVAPADLVAPAKRRRGRGGKRPGPKPGSKRGPGRAAAETPAGRVRSVGGATARALPSEAKREACRKLYEGGMELPAIAARENVKYATLYGWKTNGEWERN